MKIEKKLIAYSAIALMVGIASIVPLVFLMSAKAETTPKQWFNLNVPYAYIKTNYTEDMGLDVYNYWHSVVLNFTLNPETENEISDARFEYFELQIYTDKEPLGNTSYYVGTNRTSAFEFEAESFHFMRDDRFDSNTSSGGWFTPHWNISDSAETIIGGSVYNSPAGQDEAPKTVTVVREAGAIFIDVRRIGFVTFNGNSTVVTLSDNGIIQHIELKKFGDGFLYNTLLPEDQLLQIDLLNPLKSLNQQKP